MKRKIQPLVAASALVLALVLAGCTAQQPMNSPSALPSREGAEAVESSLEPLVTGLSNADRAAAIARCLQDRSWPTIYEDGRDYYDTEYTDAQADRYAADESERQALYRGPAEPLITNEYVERIYNEQLATATCLEELGIVVSEPPSLQVYRDSFETDQQWIAYGAASMSPSEFESASLACPQPDGF